MNIVTGALVQNINNAGKNGGGNKYLAHNGSFQGPRYQLCLSEERRRAVFMTPVTVKDLAELL